MPRSLVFGPWGLLPIAVPCALLAAARLGRLVFPADPGLTGAAHRVVAGAVLLSAGLIATVRLLGAVHLLTGPVLLAVLVIAAITLCLLGPRPTFAFRLVARRIASFATALVTRANAPILFAALVAVGVATLTAYWLPVWQWDALGYHLPYVNFALLARSFDAIPTDMPYVSTYPHDVEILMIVLRSMLPDDRLVDLAQIPGALLGAAATAGIARLAGASRPAAIASGAAWVVVPAVFLQMPTDYVDDVCAAFFLSASFFVLTAVRASTAQAPSADPSYAKKALLLGGLSLGVYLGTKPNAPLSAAIVGLLLVVAGVRLRARGALAVAVLLAAAGCEQFLVNAVHYGNPVYPVRVHVGPFTLPGTESMQHLLDSGALAPHLQGSLPSRIVRSWTSLTSPPVFDMRIGGFGPLVLLAMPFALYGLYRRRDVAGAVVLFASVVAPDPSVARYVMAFPALLLGFAAPAAGAVPSRVRPWLGLLAGLAGLWQIAYASRGLIGDGPPLMAYARMTDAQRAEAVGANGPPTPFMQARRHIAASETFAFDQSLDLPYLAWESDLRYRAVWIPGNLTSTRAAEDFLDRENVRVVAAAQGSPVGERLAQEPERYLKLFPCKSAPCSVFVRR